MGSSFTDCRGHGFWARDAKIELWLYLLTLEIDNLDGTPPWLRGTRDDWRLQATAGLQGCVSASLDEHLGEDADRVALLLRVVAGARRRMLGYGPAIPRTMLNSFGLPGTFTGDLDPGVLLPVVDAFTALLRGEVGWDEGTSPVL